MKENTVNSIKFSVFADLHYKKSMYIASVADLEAIFERAKESEAEFVLHAGDFCNDYQHSAELVKAYLDNSYGLSVYGIYGNHELETPDNAMSNVTPCLTNREVVWGTPDGKMGDGSIAYYYFDAHGFRFVCSDMNYSQNPETGEWEHNHSVSHGSPKGNLYSCSLGPVQLSWLEDVLTDAARTDKKCIFLSHGGVSPLWYPSPDAEAVRKIFDKINALKKGTVLMAINGHLHTNHIAEENGVVYFDVNTVRNTKWVKNEHAIEHYGDITYSFVEYDADGNEIARYDRPIAEVRMAKNQWFNTDPLSAIVTVWENGRIEIEGSESTWLKDILPPPERIGPGVEPRISSAIFAALEERD